MIKSLYIKDYAIIDNIRIDFNTNFEVFTGETGAGKSIIIGALAYLTGGRADSSIIRHGKEKAIIEGIFSLTDSMKAKLDEAELDYEDELIVRRTFSMEGKNTIRVNDQSVTLNFLSDLLEGEIDVHSQKDSQYLLKKQNHLHLLDKFAQNEELYKNYQKTFNQYKTLKENYNQILNSSYNDQDLDYYRFSLEEIGNANLSIEEEEELLVQEKRIKTMEKSINALNRAIAYFEEEEGVSELLYSLIRELNVDDDQIDTVREKINDLYYSLEEEMSELKNIRSSFDISDSEIDYIQERLFTINRLKRKYNTDLEGILKYHDELKEKIELFENKEAFIAEQEKKINEVYKEVEVLANELSKTRYEAKKQLEDRIIEQLNDLVLPNAQFEVSIQEKNHDHSGKDDVEFLISLNKGEVLKPLVKVASGGEISRVMLGLKTIFSALSGISVVVFDEIDTGVSGLVATAIGKKMVDISKNIQVLAITHLAPVAAFADEHLFIYKIDENDATLTQIKTLDEESRIQELALISSSSTSDASLLAAKALYLEAQNYK